MSKLATQIKSKLAKLSKIKGKNFDEKGYFMEVRKRATVREKNIIGTNTELSIQETIIKIIEEDIAQLSRKS